MGFEVTIEVLTLALDRACGGGMPSDTFAAYDMDYEAVRAWAFEFASSQLTSIYSRAEERGQELDPFQLAAGLISQGIATGIEIGRQLG